MTKKDIALTIAEKAKMKQVVVKEVIQRLLEHVTDSLAKGEKIELRNFGVFKVKLRRPRVGRNPKTGETVNIPERKTVVFKPGMAMKKKVR